METYVKLSIIDRQFQDAIRNISLHASRLLQTPADRVRIAEWIRKLCGSPSSTCNSEKWSQIRNEYALYLRMMMKHSPFRLVSPFNKPATEYDLPPLSEMLGNTIQQSYTKFPKTGPIKPVMCHTCADGKAFMTVQRCPQSGAVYCYMAVAPVTLQKHSQTVQENA